MKDNKVLLIGENHHNILGAVRSFGVNGIYPYGIIVGNDSDKSFVRKSKYWKKTWTVTSEKNLIAFLLQKFDDEKLKIVIIPCSDSIAEIIDLNYDILKSKFILPSIDGKQGKIAELMDKQRQVEFAEKYNFLMAKSYIIELNNILLKDDILYPCIIKPVVSTDGKKSDIKKISDKDEMMSEFIKLKNSGYCRVLVQEYLNYDAEYVMIGAIHDSKLAWFNSEKIRIWPVIGGSSSFLRINNDLVISDFYKKIRESLIDIKYDGCFDIDAFCVNGKMYLNEINWRNSGAVYSTLASKVYYPVLWYYWTIGKNIPGDMKITCDDKTICSMDESKDLRHVACKNISFKRWIKDHKQTKAFSLWNIRDIKPAIIQYIHLVKKLIIRKGV